MPQPEREQHIYHSVMNALEDFRRKNELLDRGNIHIYIDKAENPEFEYVRYKKYIYALRPLLACRFIETYHSVPPVKFDTLLQQDLPQELTAGIDRMLEIKAQSDEKELNPHIPVIRKYIADEIVRYEQILKEMADDRKPDWGSLDSIFLWVLQQKTYEKPQDYIAVTGER